MLKVTELNATIDGAAILTDISLEVARGEWIAIIGPNGAGKSSLLRTVTGALGFEGCIEIDGRDVASLRRSERAQLVGWVAQSPVIPIGMRVVDFVLLGRTPHLPPLGRTSARDRAVVSALFGDLDLADVARRWVDTLSGGERQRVLIARALAQESPLVLLDEPTTALDLGHQQEVLALLERLRSTHGLTVVTTMHDLTLAGQYADRLVVLSHGALVEQGTAADVLTETNLRRYWNAKVEIIRRADGSLVIVPTGPASNETPPGERDIHEAQIDLSADAADDRHISTSFGPTSREQQR
ncbi:MAG: ABC transporter ATP-binding protein [Acidobacteria bacterium]|nr:ABC transporter ATP-binding protein [Acidobacteriota bacterium]